MKRAVGKRSDGGLVSSRKSSRECLLTPKARELRDELEAENLLTPDSRPLSDLFWRRDASDDEVLVEKPLNANEERLQSHTTKRITPVLTRPRGRPKKKSCPAQLSITQFTQPTKSSQDATSNPHPEVTVRPEPLENTAIVQTIDLTPPLRSKDTEAKLKRMRRQSRVFIPDPPLSRSAEAASSVKCNADVQCEVELMSRSDVANHVVTGRRRPVRMSITTVDTYQEKLHVSSDDDSPLVKRVKTCTADTSTSTAAVADDVLTVAASESIPPAVTDTIRDNDLSTIRPTRPVPEFVVPRAQTSLMIASPNNSLLTMGYKEHVEVTSPGVAHVSTAVLSSTVAASTATSLDEWVPIMQQPTATPGTVSDLLARLTTASRGLYEVSETASEPSASPHLHAGAVPECASEPSTPSILRRANQTGSARALRHVSWVDQALCPASAPLSPVPTKVAADSSTDAAICPDLTDCNTPVAPLLAKLTSSTRGLQSLLIARGVTTVGQLAQLTVKEVSQLPIRQPKHETVVAVLNSFARRPPRPSAPAPHSGLVTPERVVNTFTAIKDKFDEQYTPVTKSILDTNLRLLEQFKDGFPLLNGATVSPNHICSDEDLTHVTSLSPLSVTELTQLSTDIKLESDISPVTAVDIVPKASPERENRDVVVPPAAGFLFANLTPRSARRKDNMTEDVPFSVRETEVAMEVNLVPDTQMGEVEFVEQTTLEETRDQPDNIPPQLFKNRVDAATSTVLVESFDKGSSTVTPELYSSTTMTNTPIAVESCTNTVPVAMTRDAAVTTDAVPLEVQLQRGALYPVSTLVSTLRHFSPPQLVRLIEAASQSLAAAFARGIGK